MLVLDAGTKLGGGGGDAPGTLPLPGGTAAPGGENPGNPGGGVVPGGRKGGKGGRAPDGGRGKGEIPVASRKPGGAGNPGLLLKIKINFGCERKSSDPHWRHPCGKRRREWWHPRRGRPARWEWRRG